MQTQLRLHIACGVALLLTSCGTTPSPASSASVDTQVVEAAMPLEDHASRAASHERPGFSTYDVDGRLWIFREDSQAEAAFLDDGPPAAHVTRPGAGPGGLTLKAVDDDVLLEWAAVRDGFEVRWRDDVLWVFEPRSLELAEFDEGTQPRSSVSRPSGGPFGSPVRATDEAVLSAYLYGKAGFEVFAQDGRLWVFEAESENAVAFRLGDLPEQRVSFPGAGPDGLTVESPRREVALEYLCRRDGFHTRIVDGRLWVFRADDPEWERFEREGAILERVTLPLAGPLGTTLVGSEREALDRYLLSLEN